MTSEVMTGEMNAGQQRLNLIARLERVPFSRWHVKIRVLVGTATLFDAIDALMIAYIMPVLVPLWSIDPTRVGLLISISYVGKLLGALFFGWFSERYGRKKSLIFSVLVMGIMSLACAFAWDYWSLFIFRFIQGLGLGGEVPVAASYISEWSKAKGRGKFVMLYEMVFAIGVVLAGLLGRAVIPAFGWQVMFILGAIPALLVPAFLRALPESPRWLINRGRYAEADKVIEQVETYVSRLTPLPPVDTNIKLGEEKKTNILELFQGIYLRRTFTIWVLWFCVYFVNYGLQTWLPTLYSTVFNLSIQRSLVYSIIPLLVGLAGNLISAFLIDRVGRKPWFAVSFLAVAVALFALAMTGVTSAEILLLFTTINMFFVSPMSAGLYLYTPELYPTRLRGFGSSTGSGWLRIASIIGPNIVGVVVAQYSLSLMFIIFSCVALAGAICAAAFAVETKGRVLEEISP